MQTDNKNANIGRPIRIFANTCILAALAGIAICSTANASPVASSAENGGQSNNDPLVWSNDKWTGDDRPFAAARLSVDRLFQSGVDAQTYISKIQKVAEANPSNALDQFVWVYAVCKQREKPHPVMGDISRLTNALASADPPHCSDYDRLRLVVFGAFPEERGIAERLLAIDPNDIWVKAVYAGILSESRQESDAQNAIEVEISIVKSGDDSPTCYLDLGQIYATVGFLQHDMSDYTKAIAAENEFLSLTPAYDWRCNVARHCIQVLQTRLEGQQ